MAEIERLTRTISRTAARRTLPPALKPRRADYTGKEGIQALALRGIMGVDLTAIPTVGPGTALVDRLPSTGLALAPGTRISGGKNLHRQVLRSGQPRRAAAARRSETFIGAKGRLAGMDTPVVATARELCDASGLNWLTGSG